MKEMTMLELDKVDLHMLRDALEDHSPTMQWWFDPRTGESIPKSEDIPWEELGLAEGDEERLVAIEATPSYEGYSDMEEFIARVRDPRARELLARAIEGRGAFRRFKDTLFEFEALREAWFMFHDARAERRAIAWLAAEGLIDERVADQAIEARPDPEPPEISGAFDAHTIAAEVAADLRDLYGERLRSVILFGSWARGDADPESDIDLLVVLDRVDSSWDERRRMRDVLWRHSLDYDTVVVAIPVSEERLQRQEEPLLIRAREEGLAIA
jgi:predicted nucleotidyltransferase